MTEHLDETATTTTTMKPSEYGIEIIEECPADEQFAEVPTMFGESSVYSFDSLTATFEDNFTALESFLEQQNDSDITPLGSESTWNEEVKSEVESLGLSLHDSLVMALRDGANKMDAAITADYVATLNEEVKRLKRLMNEKTQQVCELQSLLQVKEDRISTLELERDLYKADTRKLSNDVRALVVKVKEIEASSSQDTTSTSTPLSDPLFHDQGSPTVLPTASVVNSSIPSEVSPNPDCPKEPAAVIAIPEKKASKERPKHTLGGRALKFCRQMQMKRLGHSLQKNATERSEEDSEADSVFSEQLQQLRHRLKTSMTTSEELRRRLAMVSRYYEGALRSMEEDMLHRLTSLSNDKDDVVEQLQRKVRELEDDLSCSKNTSPRSKENKDK